MRPELWPNPRLAEVSPAPHRAFGAATDRADCHNRARTCRYGGQAPDCRDGADSLFPAIRIAAAGLCDTFSLTCMAAWPEPVSGAIRRSVFDATLVADDLAGGHPERLPGSGGRRSASTPRIAAGPCEHGPSGFPKVRRGLDRPGGPGCRPWQNPLRFLVPRRFA